MSKVFLWLFLLISTLTYSQTEVHQDWRVENPKSWGSFYWGVSRTIYADSHGKYWYYVYFYSNSLFNSKRDGRNYDKASTYIKNVNIYMDEYKWNGGRTYKSNTTKVSLPYITCDWNYDINYYGAYFWSYSNINNFRITFDKASAFDYSIY